MKITGRNRFPLSVLRQGFNTNDIEGTRGEIIKWCSINCKSRWIIATGSTNVSVFAPLSFENPISNKKFPAAKMEEYSKIILMIDD